MRDYMNVLIYWLKALAIFISANLVWWLIISFIDGEWDVSKWYLYTRGWGRFILIVIEALVIAGAAETLTEE